MWQSEQSIARAIDGVTGEPILVVGFNDGGGTLDRVGGLLPDPNKMGYSTLLDSATEWRYSRVPVQTRVPGALVSAAYGDPWLATNVTRDRIYYLNLGRTRFSPDNEPDALLLSVHDAQVDRGFWRPAWTSPEITNQESVSVVPGGEAGNDKPSVAISQDAHEDVYIAYVCGLEACGPARRGAVHFLRIDRTGLDFLQTRIDAPDSVGVVTNPIVATSPHEPNSVFVAYQVLIRDGDNPAWVVRLSKSGDRGATFPAFVNISPASVAPDINIRGTVGFMRNLVFMDYFAAGDGWQYAVWEDAGQVYFSRSEPSTMRRDGLVWSTPERLSLAPPGGPHPRDFQPAVAASGSRVAVVFYEQARSSPRTFVATWVSDSPEVPWRIATLSRDDAGAEVAFEPCLLRNRREGYYGDYIDVVPMALPGLPDDGFYAAWTDSRVPAGEPGPACSITTFANAVHQHTYGTVFR